MAEPESGTDLETGKALTAEQLDTTIADNDGGDSVREALESAFQDAEDAEVPAAEPLAAPEPAKEAEGDGKTGQTRSPDGKFTKKEDGAPPAKASDAKSDEESPAGDEVAAKPPSDTDETKTGQGEDAGEKAAGTPQTPPATWSAEEKAEFMDLPPGTQAAVLRREGDRDRAFSQQTAELNQVKARYAALDTVLEPYNEVFALNGIDTAKLFGQYLATDKAMARDPLGTLQMMAKRMGVDLSSASEPLQGDEDNPRIAALQRQLDEQTLLLNNFQTTRTDEQTRIDTERQTGMAKELDDFAQATNDDGSLKHPHFGELRYQMGAAIHADPTKKLTLDAAYERALWASPDHREGLLANQRRTFEKEAEASRKKHAEQAKSAAVSVTGAPGGAEPPAPVGSVGEELRKAFAAQG